MSRVEVHQPSLEIEGDAIFGPAADHMQWNAVEGVMDMTENRYDPPSCEREEYMDWSVNGGNFHWGEDDGGLGWGGADTDLTSLPAVPPQAVSPDADPSFSEENDPVASGSPIEVQVPSFAMPTQAPLPCQAPQLNTRSKVVIRMDQLAASRGDWKPVSPPVNWSSGPPEVTTTIAPTNGVFARYQFLPFAFHVLGGPMQRQVEINISVSLT
jgi:hypothetical protein